MKNYSVHFHCLHHLHSEVRHFPLEHQLHLALQQLPVIVLFAGDHEDFFGDFDSCKCRNIVINLKKKNPCLSIMTEQITYK